MTFSDADPQVARFRWSDKRRLNCQTNGSQRWQRSRWTFDVDGMAEPAASTGSSGSSLWSRKTRVYWNGDGWLMTQIWADSQSAETTHSRRPLRSRCVGCLSSSRRTGWLWVRAVAFGRLAVAYPGSQGGEAVWVDPSLAVWCRRSAHCATDPSDDRCAGAGRHESTHVCQKHEKCL